MDCDLIHSSMKQSMKGEMLQKGAWLQEEDEQLTTFVTCLGEGRWDSLAKVAGEVLFSHVDQSTWSKTARSLSGRTDNEVKNCWRIHLRKKARVKQEDEFRHKPDNTEQGALSEENMNVNACKDYNQMNFECQENVGETKHNSSQACPPSEWEIASSSPYEIRVSEWIAELQNDDNEIESEHHCNSTQSTESYYSTWFDSDTWAYSYSAGSIWDMN